MKIHIFPSKLSMAVAAAEQAASGLKETLLTRGEASLILATGASQFEMLSHLVTLDVDWSRVAAFHLDEYIRLPSSHPASFRRYLQERFVDKVPGLHQFHS
jgi:glucosamine-6-phosphate deaminase